MNKLFWLWISLSILLFLFILIIFSKITILVNYYHHNDNDDLKVELRVWFGLIKYKMNVPLIKIDDNSPSVVVKSHSHMGDAAAPNPEHRVNQITKKDVTTNFKKMRELLEKVFNFHVIVRKFLRKVTIKKLEWDSFVGVGDAAYTGMATGALWAIKGGIIGLLSHYLRLKEMPDLSVTPHFQAAVIQTRFSCMFQFRIGHAILAGLKLIKFWKGGNPRAKSNNNFKNEKSKSV
ncbi:DUF2953 domain-containing protein [Bacillus salipaludis]|uniref:DUF2953 domain-containing protein n=1 Tax=Bacillus salipaludis TaxID=2547811 RepID=A0ABW8REQ5_9BACI